MLIRNTHSITPPDFHEHPLLAEVSENDLRNVVERIAMPRHYVAEPANNAAIGQWIETEFQRLGLVTYRQGWYGNIVAAFNHAPEQSRVLVGAHYDSVPRTPGADDNGSAVAAMLTVAKVLAESADTPAVTFVAFNREEDGLLGSTDFVQYLRKQGHGIEIAHILEMVGYCDHRPGSQRVPPGLPIKLSDVGDFIGIIANRSSNHLVSALHTLAAEQTPSLPVKTLQVFLGMEKYFPHLLRSDHSPFWEAGIPALMWTDTSEFRNPHYHQPSDTPDTLDYAFLAKVTKLLLAACLRPSPPKPRTFVKISA